MAIEFTMQECRMQIKRAYDEGPVTLASRYRTTFTGFPFRNACTFAAAICMSLVRASLVAHAIWGVMIQFFAVNKGLF
jgi:hypothetical protein